MKSEKNGGEPPFFFAGKKKFSGGGEPGTATVSGAATVTDFLFRFP